jgi:hypothetical protein
MDLEKSVLDKAAQRANQTGNCSNVPINTIGSSFMKYAAGFKFIPIRIFSAFVNSCGQMKYPITANITLVA